MAATSTTTTSTNVSNNNNNNNISAGGFANSDSGHHTVAKDHLSVLARSTSHHPRNSRNSHHSRGTSIISSSRFSVQSIRSHVSSFQNVRFEPEPIKDISFCGGIALLISNMTGPGLVTIPVVAQSAGWLPTLLGFGLVALLSTLSSLFICEAMTEVPGNEYFQANVEFSNLVLCFFGRRYHLLVQIVCFLAMQTTNIASIAVSAQLFDNLLIKIFHRTCGIAIYPRPSFVCVAEQLQSASPFSGIMIMTTGVVLALAMIIPLALLKLSENIWLQLVSFILILLIVLQWIITFFQHGLDPTLVPAVGPDISQTFGTVLFNYAFITTVPSWANAKKPSVSIHKTLGWSVSITTVVYLCVAIIGGMAYEIPANSSLIQAINSAPNASILSQVTGYTFPIAALITSVPINIIVIRYNLIQSGACNMVWSNILSGVLPWLVAIPCMTGSGLTTVINWSSLFLVSTANFIIPFILYIYSKKHRDKLNTLPIIEMEQHARLSRELSRSSISGHSRRGTSVSGSMRRRLTGSGQSHAELPIAPHSALAAATILPMALGIGTGSIIQHSISEENLVGGECSRPVHRRFYSHQSIGHASGHGGEQSISESFGGPYFSYSRDGELFEAENMAMFGHGVDSRSASSSVHRPSGVSTVVLHDPASEMAQRKAGLPRRVSHKDKIMSMISEKHKRAMEHQERNRQNQQKTSPVPPMILLSQSAIESDVAMDENNDQERQDPEKQIDEKNIQHSHDSANDTNTAKRLNRKSSIPPAPKSTNRTTLTLPPSSPPLRSNSANTPMLEIHSASTELFQPGSPHLSAATARTENILQPSPTFSPPRLADAQRSSKKRSPSDSPRRESPKSAVTRSPLRPSITLTFGSGYGVETMRETDMTSEPGRLGPQTGAGSLPNICNTTMQPSPSTPDSSASIHSLDRRVSFSNDRHTSTLSPPELDARSSFSSETKRVMRAAMASLAAGGSPSRFGSSSSLSSTFKDSKPTSVEWATALLEHSDEESPGHDEEGEHEAIGPELRLADDGSDRFRSATGTIASVAKERRDSTGRMAAAFIAQPGSFAICTCSTDHSPAICPLVSSQATSVVQSSACPHHPPPPSVGLSAGMSFSPSVPPGLTFQHSPTKSHARTFSASAAEDDKIGSERAPRQSTQSLRERAPGLVSGMESAASLSIHLMPPSPSLGQHGGRFDRSSSHTLLQGTTAITSSLTFTAVPPPSPQQRGQLLGHRSSFSTNRNNNNRLSGSYETLVAPFQGGKNYAIPGFSSSSHGSQSSSTYQTMPPSSPTCLELANHPQHQPGHRQRQSESGSGMPLSSTSTSSYSTSWLNWRRHSRDVSRSTMASGQGVNPLAKSVPPSPKPSTIGGGGGVGRAQRSYIIPGTSSSDGLVMMRHSSESRMGSEGYGHHMDHIVPASAAAGTGVGAEAGAAGATDSHQYLPQYMSTIAFDQLWSLRAIPRWIPVSSLKIAWGSLGVLVVAIGATIVYDIWQVAA
ncbi:hypothetical protein BG004_004036, partial [Podila humilis]